MIPSSFGDLARSLSLRSANARLSADLTRLGTELTTGQKQDWKTPASGDVGPLAAIDRQLTGLDSFATARSEAELFLDVTQHALERIAGPTGGLRSNLLMVSSGSLPPAIDANASEARQTFLSTVSALNVSAGGRSVFAGTASDGPALADGDTMLAEIAAAAAGATTAADAAAAVDAYFAPGGGFETSGYVGSTTSLAPFSVTAQDRVDADLRADDPALRAVLAGQAKAAILAEGVLAGADSERIALSQTAAADLTRAIDGLVGVRGKLGAAQGRVEQAGVRIDTERTALRIARQGMVGIDPYETASRLEQTRGQLETLYSVTARLSRLSLTNYL